MTTATQRQRRKRFLASFLDTPCIDGKFRDFHGDPRQAPKRWKRLWARQWTYVRGVSAANLLRLQRAQLQTRGTT
ncbi:hypothetical protein [Comamonas sp. UBA7528]|jgi:hypothetical protein|uniref:hypothetical protein n=1 Tax=Comamonas sp. UBA7528 TaxID=1946391 RepID=UPI0025C3FFB8|nr:hypothetical protein [Comamonas sp. UBA7528]